MTVSVIKHYIKFRRKILLFLAAFQICLVCELEFKNRQSMDISIQKKNQLQISQRIHHENKDQLFIFYIQWCLHRALSLALAITAIKEIALKFHEIEGEASAHDCTRLHVSADVDENGRFLYAGFSGKLFLRFTGAKVCDHARFTKREK